MKKWKYFKWKDPNMGYGVGPALFYIEARSKLHAKQILHDRMNFEHDPHFIAGDVIRIKEFIQPKQIEIIS